MNFLREYQQIFLIILQILCVIAAVISLISRNISSSRKIPLCLLELSTALLLLSDSLAYYFRGNTSQTGWWMVRISNFGIFLFSLCILFNFNSYLKQLTITKDKKRPLKLLYCDIFLAISLILLIISLFTKMYYSFDETNHYHRSSGIIITFFFPVIVLLLQLAFIIQNFKFIDIKIRFPLIFFTILPIITTIFQIFMYGLSLLNLTFGILSIILCICDAFIKDKADKLETKAP